MKVPSESTVAGKVLRIWPASGALLGMKQVDALTEDLWLLAPLELKLLFKLLEFADPLLLLALRLESWLRDLSWPVRGRR